LAVLKTFYHILQIVSCSFSEVAVWAKFSWHYYCFRICQDGIYAFYLYTHTGGASNTFLDASTSSIHICLGQINLIAVVANNDILNLYVNHQLVNTQQDSTFSSGQIAVVAENGNSTTEVVFRNARVWQF
jgi:hypothetical protein